MRELIPWWGRIAAKLVLSRLPAGYGAWRRLNVFTHGEMHRADYALNVFQQHFARAGIPSGRVFVALELGPGDSLASAVIAAAHGAHHTYLVDAGRFATTDLSVYRHTASRLRELGLSPPDIDHADTIDTILQVCRASYATEGLRSLQGISSGSVDFVWSHAVLEHVRRHELPQFIREMRRIVRDDGMCSHQIDLQDHLGGSLNNLRVPTRWWEAEWMARSGFYTNRVRMSEMIALFEAARFTVSGLNAVRWEELPTPRHRLAREFQTYAPEDLLVKSFDVALSPNPS